MEKEYKELGCQDVNPHGDCAFKVRAATEEEVLRLGAEHARHAHSAETLPPDLAAKVKAAIKTVKVKV